MGHAGLDSHRVTLDQVVKQLRKRDFGVLSTADLQGRPHAVGVLYGVSPPGTSLAIYVMTRSHLRKARNIAANPNLSEARVPVAEPLGRERPVT